jgi:hypothetical protein
MVTERTASDYIFKDGCWVLSGNTPPQRERKPIIPGMKPFSERKAEIHSRPVADDLINDWMPTSPTLMLIAGRPGIGKTFLLLDILSCLASGIPFLSHKVKTVKVGLLSLEGDEVKLLNRIETIISQSYHDAESNLAWSHTIPVKLNSPNGKEWLRTQFIGKQVVGIDTLTKLTGDINSPKEVGAFLAYLKEVMVETGTSVIGTLHCRKPDKRIKIQPSDLIFEIRGAVDFVAEAQSVLLLERARQTRSELGKFGSNVTKRTLYTAKLKDSPVDEQGINLTFNDTMLRFLPMIEEEDIYEA